MRALEGIGEKSVKILADKGITSFEDVRKADSERLQLLLGRCVYTLATSSECLTHDLLPRRSNAPFGRKLVNQAKSMPKFSLNLTADSEDVVDTGIRVTALVEVGLLNTKPACLVKKANINFLAIILLTTSDGEFIELVHRSQQPCTVAHRQSLAQIQAHQARSTRYQRAKVILSLSRTRQAVSGELQHARTSPLCLTEKYVRRKSSPRSHATWSPGQKSKLISSLRSTPLSTLCRKRLPLSPNQNQRIRAKIWP